MVDLGILCVREVFWVSSPDHYLWQAIIYPFKLQLNTRTKYLKPYMRVRLQLLRNHDQDAGGGWLHRYWLVTLMGCGREGVHVFCNITRFCTLL